jgi:hypothetical protein
MDVTFGANIVLHYGFSASGMLSIVNRRVAQPMATACKEKGCKNMVPRALESPALCLVHFTLLVEKTCAEIRRETVYGKTPHGRQMEIVQYIADQGEMLTRAATGGVVLADEMKARILNTLLTLMNLRENLDRAAMRQPVGRTGGT